MKRERLRPGEKRGLIIVWAVAVALFLAGVLYFCLTPPVSVSFIDVGQGDACLIQAGHRGNVLIDGGDVGSGSTLKSYLANQNVRVLDGVFVSHFHEDHMQGIRELMESNYPIRMLYLPEISDGSEEEEAFLKLVHEKRIPMRRVSAGEVLTIGKGRYHILWPEAKADMMEANNQSLVIRMEYGENRILFTGDIELSAQAELAALQPEALGAQVLKVPHHGGASSVYAPFLEACQPAFAAIGVGIDNYYDHPSREMLEALQSLGTGVYRTDLHGTVKLVLDKEHIKRIETTDKWRKLR